MTVSIPGKLTKLFAEQVKEHSYPTRSDYCVALAIWDIYSRQKHSRTGPLMRMPQWAIDNAVDDLLRRLKQPVERGSVVPHRFTVRVPTALYRLVQVRKVEELYRSGPLYFTGLILFALDPDVPPGKGIPHHKLVPLMQQPDWLKNAVFEQIAADFDNPERKWLSGVGERVAELVKEQLQLGLKK